MVRPRKPSVDDLNIYKLTRQCLLPYTRKHFPDMKLSRSSMRKRLREGVTLVDRGRGGFKGYVHALMRNETLWIDLLAVRKSYRRTGVGFRLMLEVEEWGKRNGAKQAMLYVNEENKGAKQFYERCGFRYKHTNRSLHCDLYAKPFATNAPSTPYPLSLFPVQSF